MAVPHQIIVGEKPVCMFRLVRLVFCSSQLRFKDEAFERAAFE